MTVKELLGICDLSIATQEKLAECEPFLCNNNDLNNFFAHDVPAFQRKLLSKTYVFCLKKKPHKIVSAFTLSNDSIRINNKVPEEDKKKFLEETELSEKNLRRYPSVLIGRLGTNREFEDQGYGSAVMDFIKLWFRIGSKTECRFIIVDAYNNPRTLHYYQKNQFEFLIDEEQKEAKYMGVGVGRLPLNTRLMYFDLLNLNVGERKS
jgi:GNAT superfamily N-acetyltransferase